MSNRQNGNHEDETECTVCGTAEKPDEGWIYRSGDVKPVPVEGDIRWEPTEDADALCSTECMNEYKKESGA